MKTITAYLLSLALLSVLATPIHAETQTRKKQHAAKKYRHKHYRRPAGDEDASGYYVRDADKLPFGSSVWWEQMDREGRGGQSRAN